jgi:hypothetical protein
VINSNITKVHFIYLARLSERLQSEEEEESKAI